MSRLRPDPVATCAGSTSISVVAQPKPQPLPKPVHWNYNVAPQRHRNTRYLTAQVRHNPSPTRRDDHRRCAVSKSILHASLKHITYNYFNSRLFTGIIPDWRFGGSPPARRSPSRPGTQLPASPHKNPNEFNELKRLCLAGAGRRRTRAGRPRVGLVRRRPPTPILLYYGHSQA